MMLWCGEDPRRTVQLGFARKCAPSWKWGWILLGAGNSLEEQGSCSTGVGSDCLDEESAA